MGNKILKDDVAIVTGAIRNIGREIAETFAENGAKVAIVHHKKEPAAATAAEIRSDGYNAVGIRADVTDANDVASMVETVEEKFGKIDILVNNAAVSDRSHFIELDVEMFDKVLAVNLRGTFLCTQAAAQSMKKSGGGRIINISSTSAHRGRPNATAYATSKSGILNFTRSTAKALAEDGIRVNTLSPTRSGSRVGSDTERSGPASKDILAGRWGTPRDQANAALFLASPQNDFITGTELLVDGGSSA